MNKEALLNIILSDIKEVETLLKSFQGSDELPAAFVDLTERKLNHISEEFALFKSINHSESATSIKAEKKQEHEVIDKPNAAPKEQPTVIIEKHEPIIEEKVIISNIVEEKEPIIEVKEEQPIIEIKEEKPITEQNPEVEIYNKVDVVSTTQIIEEAKPAPIETAIPKINIEVKKPEVKEESAKTLGESLGGEKKSVNDIIANNKESKLQQTLMGKPIDDLTKSLGLNDRFMFQRELFQGNADIMKQTLLQLNEMPDFNSAQAFISSNFSWDHEQEATQAFFSYVKRKFH